MVTSDQTSSKVKDDLHTFQVLAMLAGFTLMCAWIAWNVVSVVRARNSIPLELRQQYIANKLAEMEMMYACMGDEDDSVRKDEVDPEGIDVQT
ncbi:unnamed protein product, partial [Mesorhabditis spiculigera]